MMINVVYEDDRHDMLKDFLLERYIKSGRIIKFKRSGGWVTVGIDQTRGRGGSYGGIERRSSVALLDKGS
ncbi:MAG: hypothetical protein WCG31_03570 [Deltaproteobacteria bacterium]